MDMAPDEQMVHALVGEILALNPQLQGRPNLIYPGEEIKLQADWIMAMRPSQPPPVATPPPPPAPPQTPYLPSIIRGCPPAQPPSMPIRLELKYPGNAIPTELIIFPPDVPPRMDKNRDRNRALLWSWLGAAADAVELVATPFGILPDFTALVDVGIAATASYYSGETYLFERPHASLPRMVVLGQDVVVTTGDAAVAALAKTILPALGLSVGSSSGTLVGTAMGGVVGSLGGMAVDVGTTMISLGYDFDRATGKMPTYFSYALFWEERLRQAVLIWQH